MIKVLGLILMIISLSELASLVTQEQYELEKDIYHAIETDIKKFHKLLTIVAVIDAIFGIICSLVLLWYI